MKTKKSLVIAITGASGSIYASTLISDLLLLRDYIDPERLSLVVSDNGDQVFEHEMGYRASAISGIKHYSNTDFYAPFASGSGNYDGMVIVPCSMGTLGKIAHGISDNLITRTADVMLKERNKLILVTRETPISLIHIKNMELITLAGGIVCPANPSFYSKPLQVHDLVKTVTNRIISLLGIECNSFQWPGTFTP
ncbi:MAG: UbiX family flavin prenyltransferase [Bacteroidales bacterium]|nr:UbiX family flavin prenyltransferase [Bacteroidales bacterium]HOY38323.1 UbiX family flavin prenyltransferase [Bacteroidales bacterium]HQP05137.1 UbiX family flavin prenyltransferase [Bacteroidales bacterium]